MNLDRTPLPRFYYLPRGLKAAVVMTGDDHGTGGTDEQFDAFEDASTPGCSVADWECVRATSYVYPSTSVPGASGFLSKGFELALHLNTGCNNRSDDELQDLWTTQAAQFRSAFGNLPLETSRTHCIAWSGWVNDAVVERRQGVRLDTNYYYWPGSWALDFPGMFTGSGFPMRFAEQDGSLVDVFQAATQLTDEWGDSQPAALGVAQHIDALLQRAVGADAFYGVFTANMHTDASNVPHPGATAIMAAAKRYGVPVVSAKQMLDWLDDRDGSSFQGVSYGAGQLKFHVARAGGAHGLEAMVPASTSAGALTALTRDGTPVASQLRAVKGVTYAVFPATAGDYTANYGTGGGPTNPPGPPTTGGSVPTPMPGTGQPDSDGSTLGDSVSAPVRAKVMKHSVRVTRRGIVRLQVRCPRSEVRCRVDVRLRHGGRLVAKTAATLVGGKTTKVRLRLTKRAQARLMRDGALKVKAVLRLTRGEAEPVISTTRVRLLAPGWR
jgi:hypothetical protein